MSKASGSDGTNAKEVDDEWIISMKDKILHSHDGPSHQEHVICKVHPALRKQKESAYEPIATSIGPYHWPKDRVKPMEIHKERYSRRLLSQNPDAFEDLVKMLKTNEERVRNCYLREDIKQIDSGDFIKMILYDGCFLIQLLLEYNGECSEDELMTGPEWRLSQLVSNDLLLLENQLPFFILQKIFEIVKPNEEHPRKLVKLSLGLLDKATEMLNGGVPETPGIPTIHHLLHLLHIYSTRNPRKRPGSGCEFLTTVTTLKESGERTGGGSTFLPSVTTLKESGERTGGGSTFLPSVTSLRESGVKFRVWESNLLDIRFCNGTMKIPKITIGDTTEAQLRNLIAFEQCCLNSDEFHFTSYISFMDNIVNTSKDVEALHERKILEHGLGSDDDVAKLFNNLGKELIVADEKGYLSKTFQDVNKYRKKKRNRWCASLKRNYFYSPWAIISFIAAVLILVFTGTQTVFSVLSYLDPH